MTALRITVVGAGVLGLWQALTLARRGHAVRLVEASAEPFTRTASHHAGAMLAPDSEAEAAPLIVRDAGRRGLALWREAYPDLVTAGSLVVAPPRDQSEIARFARLTERHRAIDEPGIAALEPDLQGRFPSALHFPDEAHMAAPEALAFLLDAARKAGATIEFGTLWRDAPGDDVVIDCRGLAAP